MGNVFPPSFFGMRGTGDWVTNQLPEDWNETILYLFPNGDAPLTAMMAKMGTEPTDSVKIHWWTQGLPIQAASITAGHIYNDAALTIAYVSGGVAGDHVYAKLGSEVDVDHFREGHQITVRTATDLAADVVTKCVERFKNGASSYIKLKLLEADDNSAGSTKMANATRILVSGNMNAEGAAMPDAITYDPTEWYNNTQIFRTPLEITGTAMATKLRTNPQAYPKMQKECLKAHSMEREKAFWFSVPTSGLGTNGKPERTMMGIVPAIRGTYAGHGGPAGTVSNYVTDSGYAGKSWLAGGEDWLNEQLETVFLYGNINKMAFCGNGALMAINKIVQNNGDFAWGPDTIMYGIKVREWITPLGSIALITHPLFNYELTMRKVMVIVEPENIKRRPLKTRDTEFISEVIGKTNSGYTRRDGIKEEYLTEETLELHHPLGWAFLEGFGDDNTAS
jgi:hypothetical protein